MLFLQGAIIGYSKETTATTFADASSSLSLLSAQQAALTPPLATLSIFEPHLEVVKLLFYSPPNVSNWQGASPPQNAFARLDFANKQCVTADGNHLLLAVVNVPRTGPSTLCKVLVSADGTQSRIGAAIPISPKHTVTQMAMSPNGHYLAIATNADLHIFTGPCPAEARNIQLQALGQPVITNAPPLSRVALREKCFEMPCTGISFDPSSRIAVGVCATRAVVFLPVAGMNQSAKRGKEVEEKMTFCQSFWRVVVQVFVVILVAVIIAKLQEIFADDIQPPSFN